MYYNYSENNNLKTLNVINVTIIGFGLAHQNSSSPINNITI